MTTESRSEAGHTWRARTVTLGPAALRPLLTRLLLPNGLLLVVTIAAATYNENWGWLGVGGTVMAISGVYQMSRRLMRLGLSRVDDDAPPHVWPNNQLNIDRMNEDMQRAIDNWCAAIGMALVIIGTLVAGALPFTLQALMPFK